MGLEKSNIIEIKINGKTMIEEDSKLFIDHFTGELVKKHNLAMTKRNIFSMLVDAVFKLGLIYIMAKHFPEVIKIFG